MITRAYPRGSARLSLLHEQLLRRFPAWRGTLGRDGLYHDPLLRVETTATQLRLTVPDDADDAEIQAVLDAHDPTQELRAHVLHDLARGDRPFIRFSEDVFQALLDQGVLVVADLSAGARARWAARQAQRERLEHAL